jgi:hypothetical protein
VGYLKIEDLGEDRTKITLYNLEFILNFVDFYNDWLFKSEDKKVTIFEKEMKAIKALVHYGKQETPNAKGQVRVNLTNIQENCARDLSFTFSIDETDALVEKKLTGEKLSIEGGVALDFNLDELSSLYPYWALIHAFKKVQRE